jgi:hypothetical protein
MPYLHDAPYDPCEVNHGSFTTVSPVVKVVLKGNTRRMELGIPEECES